MELSSPVSGVKSVYIFIIHYKTIYFPIPNSFLRHILKKNRNEVKTRAAV